MAKLKNLITELVAQKQDKPYALLEDVKTKLSELQDDISNETIISNYFGENGFIKYKSGLMIQWGKVTEILTTAKTITLPQSFKDMNYKVVANSLHNSNTNMYAIAVNKKNVSQFQLLANYTAQSTEAEYIAVGFSN